MPETTTTLDPFFCCCGTTTTPDPCKCASPITFDFHTNVIVPITLEINMPRGNSGFPGQNLFLKTYIHGCHTINSAYCLPNNTLATPSCPRPAYPDRGVFRTAHSPYFYIEEPANCNPIPLPAAVANKLPYWGSTTWGFTKCSTLFFSDMPTYLSNIEAIYGYLPSFVFLEWSPIDPLWKQKNFSSNFSNSSFFCCKQGILQDLRRSWDFRYYNLDVTDIVINAAAFVPFVFLHFPFFDDILVEAWKRGELDNLTLYGPVTLHVIIKWAFNISALVTGIYGNSIDNFDYGVVTHNFFVKILQFPFSGGSVNLDHYKHCFRSVGDHSWVGDSRFDILHIDDRTKFSIIFPDILNVVENMQATLHFGEITPNPAHSEDGAIDWRYVYKSRKRPSLLVECPWLSPTWYESCPELFFHWLEWWLNQPIDQPDNQYPWSWPSIPCGPH